MTRSKAAAESILIGAFFFAAPAHAAPPQPPAAQRQNRPQIPDVARQHAISIARTICQIDLYSGGETGVIDSYNYYCRIFSLTGTTLTDSLGISNAVPGTTMDDAGWKTFTFATNPVTPAADFAVVFFVDTDIPAEVTDADFDGTNYAQYGHCNECDDPAFASQGKMYWKNSDKTRASVDAEDDLGLRIWTQ